MALALQDFPLFKSRYRFRAWAGLSQLGSLFLSFVFQYLVCILWIWGLLKSFPERLNSLQRGWGVSGFGANKDKLHRIRPGSLPCPTSGSKANLLVRTAVSWSKSPIPEEDKTILASGPSFKPPWQTLVLDVTRTILVRERSWLEKNPPQKYQSLNFNSS